jgi:hypothetical protein
MDPNLFHLDWDRTFEALAGIVVLAFVMERALALFFENRRLVRRLEGRGIKELVAFVVALVVCVRWQFDAVSIIVLADRTTVLGEAITAAVIAGGSKASVKLFRDALMFRSSAYDEVSRERVVKRAEEQARALKSLRELGATPEIIETALKGMNR